MGSHQVQEIIQYVSNIFQIRPEWLIWPNTLTIFIIPFAFNIVMFWVFLEKIVKIFPGTGMNVLIAGLIGFLMLPFNQFTILIAPAAIGLFWPRNVIVKIAVTGILYALVFLVMPYLTGFLTTGRF